MAERNADALRWQMINSQLRTNDVNDLDLLAAFAAVPREHFVAPTQAGLAYADAEPLASGPAGRRLLSPRSLGLLLKILAPKPGERALTVGGGSGYAAAVLARLGLRVTALETEASAARAAVPPGVDCAEGSLAAPPPGGPFDAILVEGAFETVPDALIAGLVEGGRLVGISAARGGRRIVLYERIGGGVSARETFDAAADVLPGFARPAAFAF